MFKRFALLLRAAPTSALKCARAVRNWAVQTWRDPVRRDRAQATATFALIAAFTLASIDYLICGGMEWNPGGEAYAMELAQPRVQRVSAPLLAALQPPPPSLPMASPDERDYSVTAEELLGGPELAPAGETAFGAPLAVEWSAETPTPASYTLKTAVPY